MRSGHRSRRNLRLWLLPQQFRNPRRKCRRPRGQPRVGTATIRTPGRAKPTIQTLRSARQAAPASRAPAGPVRGMLAGRPVAVRLAVHRAVLVRPVVLVEVMPAATQVVVTLAL